MPDYGEGWKLKATITNVINPQYSFEFELMIDTGCKIGALALPLRKVKQLRLTPTADTRRTRYGGGVGIVQFYSPVRIEVVDVAGHTYSATVDPFVTPAGALLNTRLPADDLSSGRPLADAAVIIISPVQLPIPLDRSDLETPLLGALAIRALGLGLDVKNHCLLPLEEELI